jgi:hypothetical protein
MADYHSLLMRAVANLPGGGTPATRQAIYGRARKALLEQLRSLRPPLPESDIVREESALDAAIAQIEARFEPQDAPPPSPAAGPPAPPPAGKTPTVAPPPSPKSAAPSAPSQQPAASQRVPTPPAPQDPPAPGAALASAAPPRSASQAGFQIPPGVSPSAAIQSAAPRPPPMAPTQGQLASGAASHPSTPPVGRPSAGALATAASPVPARPAPGVSPGKPPQSEVGSKGAPAAPIVGAKSAKEERSSTTAPLDLTKAVRSAKTDDAHVSGAPPVVATRSDEPVQSAAAPEVPSEVDRPGSTARQDLEVQRPVMPGVGVGKPKTWLWIAAAVVLGIVVAVAGTAILMRQKPQDLAVKPPAEAREPAAPQPQAKIAERVDSAPATPPSPPASASEPKPDQSGAQGAAPASPGAEAQNPSAAPAPSAGRAAMLVASADNPQKPVVSLGSTVWSLIPPAPGQPATIAVKADADIPDLKMHATMTLRKNTDPTLQATHTIDLKFSFADGAPITGFKDVGLPQMRKEDSTAAEALTSVKVKISDVYFLIALAKGDQDTARNLDLMQTRAWFDFPLLLNDNRIAKIVFQKSPEGEAMLAKAFDAWK